MKDVVRVLFFVSFAALQSSPAAPQQAVAPPPKPADSGPSLAVTMRFIQEKLSEQGKVNFAVYIHDNADGNDWIVPHTLEISSVVPEPEACILSYHFKLSSNGGAFEDMAPFKDVQDIIIQPTEQVLTEVGSKAGHTTWSYKSDPPVFALRVRRKIHINEFDFTDEDMANRVAKAMVHAVELCGGGNNDPF